MGPTATAGPPTGSRPGEEPHHLMSLRGSCVSSFKPQDPLLITKNQHHSLPVQKVGSSTTQPTTFMVQRTPCAWYKGKHTVVYHKYSAGGALCRGWQSWLRITAIEEREVHLFVTSAQMTSPLLGNGDWAKFTTTSALPSSMAST